MSFFGRRSFNAIAVNLAPKRAIFAASKAIQSNLQKPEVLRLARNGWAPNNAHLPTLLYRVEIDPAGEDLASRFKAAFRRNGARTAMERSLEHFRRKRPKLLFRRNI